MTEQTNDSQLVEAIRAEFRRDAAGAPSGAATRAAVLAAVRADAPVRADGRTDRARRWAVPVLVAAAVVALVVATTVLPRALSRHGQPARPHPVPAQPLPPAPTPVGLQPCPVGQVTVRGVGARFADSDGNVRYAFDYYCAGKDGSRTGSTIEAFRAEGGRLVYLSQLTFGGGGEYAMDLTGLTGGLRYRSYDSAPGLAGHPGGAVMDVVLAVDPAGHGEGTGTVVAQPCLATDLTVSTAQANEPTPHQVLRLTNRSTKPCAVWGNPRYRQVSGQQHFTVRYTLRGPAGGLAANQPSIPPLLLQPGQSAYSAIGSRPMTGPACYEAGWAVTLDTGVSLGKPEIGQCGDLVGYPLVAAPNGSVDHPESEAPPAALTGNCGVTTNEIELSVGPGRPAGNGRIGMALTVSAHGATTCTIGGYPNVRALDGGGNLLVIASRQPLPGVRTDPVTVSPGHPASVLVDWSPAAASGACYPNGHLQLDLHGTGVGSGQLMGRFCDLRVHQFVAGSTGSG